jgi:Ca2+-binding RTX toxin-like protein
VQSAIVYFPGKQPEQLRAFFKFPGEITMATEWASLDLHEHHDDEHQMPGEEQYLAPAESTQTGANGATSSGSLNTVTQQYLDGYAGVLTPDTWTQMVDRIDNYNTWTASSITYSFPTEESTDYIGNGREGTLRPFTAEQAYFSRMAIDLIADLINLEFIDAGTDVNADTRFYNSTLGGTAGGAPAGEGTNGDIWIYEYETWHPDTRNYDPGNYNFHVLLHELGHTLGLSHTGGYEGDTYVEKANFAQDNAAWSMMSYLTAGSAGISWQTVYSATPMLIDIGALQASYGANMTTRTGDTVYGFNSNIADRQVLNFDQMMAETGKVGAIAIWDAGGNDSIDVTGFKQDAHIDLNEGAFSNAGGAEMLISIAYGVTVENAVTGNGNDIIAGNGVANLLQGSEGSDRLFGGAGDDILHGDGGIARDTESTFTLTQLATSVSNQKLLASNVQLLGSDGSFTFEFLWDFAQTDNELYNISFGGADFFRFPAGNMGLNFWNASEATWDPDVTRLGIADGELHRISVTYDNISGEMVVYVDGEQVHSRVLPPDTRGIPSVGNISFRDNAAIGDVRVFDHARSAQEIYDNALAELADPASIDGLLHYWRGDGSGSLIHHAGGANLVASGAPSVLTGQAFAINNDDMLFGEDGNDTLDGGAGDDVLDGGAGQDIIRGGAGSDWASYVSSQTGLTAELLQPFLNSGDAAGDVFESIENLEGSNHNDVLVGDNGFNGLRGMAGDDIILGHGGDDEIDGGDGNDGLYGHDGIDVIRGGNGLDWLYGGGDSDILYGDADTDALFGGDGIDILYGGDGGDSADGEAGDDQIYGEAGNDWLYGGLGNDIIDGGSGTDAVFGGEGSDIITGGTEGDSLDGEAGADIIYGGTGNDWLYGGTGDDQLIGEEDDDVLFGGADNDWLAGSAGADTLDGGDGDDELIGGLGVDVLYGGTGADKFTWLLADEGGDVVRDFVSGTDTINLYTFGFTGPEGQLSATAFASGDGLPADLGSANYYFDLTGRGLWYDATGGASDDIRIIAGFETGTVDYTDIFLV